jgi:hypothetical protein
MLPANVAIPVDISNKNDVLIKPSKDPPSMIENIK